jgi:hypothetical protein
MAPTNEMFRFVTLRRSSRAVLNRLESRLIRDRRDSPFLLGALFAPGSFDPKLEVADDFAATPDFVSEDDDGTRLLHQVAEFFRVELTAGVELDDLTALFTTQFPALALLFRRTPPAQLLEQTRAIQGDLWDSLYAQTTRGCDRYVSTNHLVDGLRVYHVLLLLWLHAGLNSARWVGGRFDDYHPIIDLDAAARIGSGKRTAHKEPAGRRNATATATLGSALASFRVELDRGAIIPPIVGDLFLVKQELRRYEMSEVADTEKVMRGERRERTSRSLARTTQTTTTETTSEVEESSSTKTDERFQLSSQAQTTAAQSTGVDIGVSVSAKYGPVQVGATMNASFDTSESTTDTTSQEYAKTISEEAARRVSNSIKETSSITILTETQETTLRGFNNEGGAEHINGLYRWLDKVYEARMLNYGRRVMLSFNPPEPALLFRHRLEQQEAAVLDDLVEPLHPSRISRGTNTPLPEDNTDSGFRSYLDISEDNYAELAARYDVTGVAPPPAFNLTGSKAIVVPDAMSSIEMQDDGLSVVLADSTLTVDPDYQLSLIGVYAPAGPNNSFRQFADNLHMGDKKEVTDKIVVQVGDKDWYFTAAGRGGNDPKNINTNFNTQQETSPGFNYGDRVQSSIPILVSASFSGMLQFTVVYSAVRRDDALERWQASTYAAILKGYATKRQAYDQASALATAQVESATVEQTFQLREDQYRAIELTELKRACIDLLTEGTALGRSPVEIKDDGSPKIVHDEADADSRHWRSPLASGSVVEFFERAFDWGQSTYEFHPYYWAGKDRWTETATAAGADPVFEAFLRSGSASVTVPVRPGYERPVVFFLKTGLVWGGRYLPLFTAPEMLDTYADVELGLQFDPPLQIGEPWEVRLPTSLVMLQDDDTLPEFPPAEPADNSTEPDAEPGTEPGIPDDAPF